MRGAWRALSYLGLMLCAAGAVWPQASRAVRVGPLASGRGALLPTGWLVRPAGTQAALDGYPMASVASPDGRFLAVLSSGVDEAVLAVLDAGTGRKVSAAVLPDAWLGLTIAANGRLLYVSGGARGQVHEFALDDQGHLERKRTFTTAENQPSGRDFIGDVQLDPEGRLLYAAELLSNRVLVINPSSGRVIERFQTGRRPYRILFHPDGKSFFVSSWADAAVYQHETANGQQLNFLRVGQHPTDMVWREKLASDEAAGETAAGGAETPAGGDAAFPWKARLFVALTNTNSVAVAGVSESKELRRIGTVNVAVYPRHPAGMTPGGLALSADKNKLFVVCSDANAVAVVAVNSGVPQVEGFVPAGWYPLAARAMADGRLLVFNARGTGLSAGGGRAARGGQAGSLSLVEPFDAARLMQYSRTVIENTAFREEKLDAAHDELPGHPVPRVRGETSPIEHVIYVLKGGQTYDHVLGDVAAGAGEAKYAVYGETVTPNQHKLAREFALLDNYYASGEGEADGWNWATASIAPDFVQKLWPGVQAGRRIGIDLDGDPASLPPSGRLWHQAMAAGLPVRNYGFGVTNKTAAGSDGAQVERRLHDLELSHVTNLKFRGPDPDYRDIDRVKVFLDDVAQWEAAGPMPRLVVVRLGNGRTAGTGAGKVSPKSMVADNDHALGLLVEAVSRSKYWPKTAIFVAESDGGAGADHVDAHRVPAFVISPYTRRGAVDSTLYTTGSTLRTIELILGLNPMTHFDAGATPMVRAFTTVADPRPFEAEKPRIPLDVRNPGAGR